MAMRKVNYRIKAGVAAMALALGGSFVIGSVCSDTPAVVRAQEGTESTSQQVVSLETSWKYLDDNTDPAEGLESMTAWTAADFDDSAWKEAAGKFGAKRGELTEFDGYTPTVLLQQYIEGTDTDIPTYFFRTTFTLENLSEVTSITGSLCHDDAVAVYLNGHLIKSQYMESEGQENNMYYSGVSQGAPEKLDLSLTAEQVAEYAVEGENVLAVELHNDRASSSDIYFEFTDLTVNYNEPEAATKQKSVILTLGSDETSRGLTWYANTEEAGQVQLAKASAMTDGEFPAEYTTVDATAVSTNDEGFYSNQTTLEGLEENTEYVYRVVNGDTVSEVYSFSTGAYDSDFSFAFVGDPQIGAGTTETDIEGWNTTLDTIQNDLGVDFLAFSSLASVTTIGNHDSNSTAYNEHFNLPNESTEYGETNAGTDYWFVYNNTLFMDINSNDMSTAEHKAFMEEAIAANPDVTWKTVIFHHSVYSTASHTDDSDIIQRREELPPVFDELGIDVVLMGHDHVYTRTYMMDGVTPDTSNGVQSEVTDPEGVLYLTANSASGSKYYDIKAADAPFAAVMDQSYRRTVTEIEVTDTSYTMTTYYADDMTVLDKFTINKTEESAAVDTTELDKLLAQAQELNEADYPADLWAEFETAYNAAVSFEAGPDTEQADVDALYADLKAAMDALAAGLPGTEDPGTEDPGTEDPGTENPGTETPGTDEPGTEDPGTEDPGTETPGTGDSGTETPDGSQGSGNQVNTGNNGNSGSSGSGTNSKTDGNKTSSSTPKTGDTTPASATVVLLLASGCAVAVLLKKRKSI